MRGAMLLAAHDQAQRVWGGVRLDVERFHQHLRSLGWETELPPGATEVYLACACAQGDAAACRFLETAYFDQVRASAARLCGSVFSSDEVVQRVRHKLLVGPPPGLLKYTGRGPLQAWLRSVTRRTALDALRSLKHESSREEASDLRATHGSSIESRIDRGRFLQTFEGSLARVFAQLPARDRNLLRMHYASGVGIDALGRAYGVHRATAARWIAKVRQDVFAAVKAELTGAGGGLSAAEFEDVVRLMRGQLDLALSHWDAESRASVLGLCAADVDAAGNDG